MFRVRGGVRTYMAVVFSAVTPSETQAAHLNTPAPYLYTPTFTIVRLVYIVKID